MKYIRNCPKCNKILEYSSDYNRIKADKACRVCKDCLKIKMHEYWALPENKIRKKTIFNTPEFKQKMRSKSLGVNNGFYGKKHSDDTKKIISDTSKGRILSAETKQRITNNLKKAWKNNTTHFYDKWVIKYGAEEADKKYAIYQQRMKGKTAGAKNGNFGIPPRFGTGLGICGWYKQWYFRSLKELKFILTYIDINDIGWQTGERKEFGIPYKKENGNDAIYFPDFINGNKIWEIKPKSLEHRNNNQAKFAAARDFCQKHNMEFNIVDPGKIDPNILINLYNTGMIKLGEPAKKRFIKHIQTQYKSIASRIIF